MRSPIVLALLVLAAMTACREPPGLDESLAIARFPPAGFGEKFRTGRGVYATEHSYRIYLDHDGLVPSARTQITPETFSVMIRIGTSRSRYEGSQVNEPAPRRVRSHDGADIHVQSWPGLDIVGASRIVAGDTEITYQLHQSRLVELIQIDRQVTETLTQSRNPP
jgi:hypothetical protein